MFSWWRRRRRRRILSTAPSPAWTEVPPGLPFHSTLSEEEQPRLVAIARVIEAEKHWEGCGGLELTEGMRITIALQAALLLLWIDHRYYHGVRSIFVYPSTYLRPEQMRADESDLQAILGEAWLGGPVVLAWDAARQGAYHPHDGRNLVLHEFAHKLDMLDGILDGTPPLGRKEDYARWRQVLTREYEALRRDSGKGRRTVLDKYGATNPAEFFAVATETFFEQGARLQRKHPELFETLRGFYGQDPAERPRAKRRTE